MKRKIIIVIIISLFSIILSFIIYSKYGNKSINNKIVIEGTDNNVIETDNYGGEEILEPPIKETNILEEKASNNNVQKREQEKNNVKNNQIKEDNNDSPNVEKSSTPDNKETIIKQEEIIKEPEVNETPIEEPKQEEVIVESSSNNEEDLTLKELKKHTFSTVRECWDKGIEISLTDTVNIKGTYCESVGYKGELVGYKLLIIYITDEIIEYKW